MRREGLSRCLGMELDKLVEGQVAATFERLRHATVNLQYDTGQRERPRKAKDGRAPSAEKRRLTLNGATTQL